MAGQPSVLVPDCGLHLRASEGPPEIIPVVRACIEGKSVLGLSLNCVQLMLLHTLLAYVVARLTHHRLNHAISYFTA